MTRSWLLVVIFVSAFSWQAQRSWGEEAFPVPAPPLSEDYYPCAENCHKDLETNLEKRELVDEHEDVKLHHAEQFRWCLDCHDTENRDKLRLQSGEKIDFADSYRLCGQCHGDKYRDWRRGVHGKRTGSWNGEKQYLLCAHCHNPHNPQFAALEPMPAPDVPGSGTLASIAAAAHGGGHEGSDEEHEESDEEHEESGEEHEESGEGHGASKAE